MLEFFSVIVDSSIVAHGSDVGGLSNLVACEEIGKEEASELKSVLVGTEYVLVEEEVSSEE